MVMVTTMTVPLTRHDSAYVASLGGNSTRARRDARIAAVLAEFGWATSVAHPGEELGLHPDRLDGVASAALVVCDLVCPDRDLPVEVALAATRGIAVLALIPEGAPVTGCTAQLLADAGATILRYDRTEPHQVLHAYLAELEMARSEGPTIDH